MDSLNSTTLSSGGATIVTIIAFTSAISICGILTFFLRALLHLFRPSNRSNDQKNSKEVLFFRTQLGVYSSSLLLSNMLNGIGGLFGFYWSKEGIIKPGPTCTAQGTFIQIGDFSGAYFTAIIAIHTFQSLVLHKRFPNWVAVFITVLGWSGAIAISTALTNVTTSRHGPFFNSLDLWCAISSGYTLEQFLAYYLPLIISAFVSASLFAIIYLRLRGTLIIGDGIKLNISPENVNRWATNPNGRDEYGYLLRTIIKSLLWFPFAYIILFLPITIAGLMRISGITNGTALLAIAGISASLVGLVNVLILINTLRILRSAINPRNATNGSESFFVPEAEERKLSPIEGPKPVSFNRATSEVVSPGITPSSRHNYGRAFPPPVSRPTSPGSTSGNSSRLPPTPRSGRQQLPRRSEEGNEHAPTPEMRQAWLHHSRSSSSVDSTTALLRTPSSRNLGHTRSLSSSTAQSSENIQSMLVTPIIPHSELSVRVESDFHLIHKRSRTASPAPAIIISRPTTPSESGLSPAPRATRADTLRNSVFDDSIPPVPPLPSNRSSTIAGVPADYIYTGNEGNALEYRGSSSRASKSSAFPVPSTHSNRTSIDFDHEDYEIQHVNSREKLRPAISAVARTARPDPSSSQPQPSVFPEAGFSSVTSLPESVTNMSLDSHETEGEDSLHIELRRRRQTQDTGQQLEGETGYPLLTESNEVNSSQRRLSGFPIVLSTGSLNTPDSIGADMYFGFDTLRPEAPTPTRMERVGFSLNENVTTKTTLIGLPSRNLKAGDIPTAKRRSPQLPSILDPDSTKSGLSQRQMSSQPRSSPVPVSGSRMNPGSEEDTKPLNQDDKIRGGKNSLRPSNSIGGASLHSRNSSWSSTLERRATSKVEMSKPTNTSNYF